MVKEPSITNDHRDGEGGDDGNESSGFTRHLPRGRVIGPAMLELHAVAARTGIVSLPPESQGHLDLWEWQSR